MVLGWAIFFLILNLVKEDSESTKISTGTNIIHTSDEFSYDPHTFPDKIYYSENFLLPRQAIQWDQLKKLTLIQNKLKNIKRGTLVIKFKLKKFLTGGTVAELYLANVPSSFHVYLDSVLIESRGKFHIYPDSVTFLKTHTPVRFTVHDTGFHFLIVHFQFLDSFDFQSYEDNYMMNISSIAANEIHDKEMDNTAIIVIFLLFLVILLILCFYHFFIYLFYRKVKSNLYYSLGLFFYAMIFFYLIKENITQKIFWIKYKEWFLLVPSTGFFIFLILTYYEIFKPLKYRLIRKILGIVYMVQIFFLIINIDQISMFLTFTLGLLYVFESFRMLYYAFKKKPPGYKILISGMSFFALLILVIFVTIFIKSNFSLSNNISVLLLLLGIFIVPITMSIYLAYTFGYVNIQLERNLNEVKTLSERNLRIEKEKQEILLNQNILLERQVEERTKEIQEQKKIIEEKNKDILDSIQYATRIQGSIIPSEDEIRKITGYGYVIYLPKDILSGDFYAVHHTPNGTFVIGADCTGHGVPGALMSMVGSTLIQKIIHEYKIHSPSAILEKLNEELRIFLRQDRADSESKDGMDVAIIQIINDRLIYAGANRPLWYLDNQNNLNEIRPVKTSIGGNYVNHVNALNHELNIRDLSKIFLFSDGCTDQFGGTLVKKVTSRRLKEWILQSAHLGSYDMKSFLLNKITEWKGNQEQTDDILFLCIGFT